MVALVIAGCRGGDGEGPPAAIETPRTGGETLEDVATQPPAEGGEQPDGGEGAGAPGGEASGSIVFAFPGEDTELRMRPEILEMFHEQYPNIQVQEQPVPPEGYDDQIQAAIAAGTPPDIFVSGDVWVAPFIKNRVAQDLTPFFSADPDLKEDAFYESVIDYFRGPDGHVYVMPDTIDVQRIYYNKSMFDAAGVEVPGDDWTVEDFKTIAGQLTQGEGPEKQYGFFADSWWAVWLPYVWMNGGEILSEDGTECLLGEPEAVEALEWYADFIGQGYSPSPEEMTGLGMGGYDLFVTGRVAMLQSGGWQIPGFEEETDFEWGMLPLPRGDEQATFLHLTNYVMAAGSQNQDAAWTFLKFLASPEVYNLEAAKYGWGVPPRPDVAEAFVASPPEGATEKNIENVRIGQLSAPNARLPVKILNWDEFTADGVDVALEELWSGARSAEEAAQAACAVTPEPLTE
ncbi:MAG TPA: sugar ABC transporter substrate-binding protein [Ardenticatenaceae bacterium]|nr:sugar ABC transporter substrate-binding protein [Ardenticatenaceae bacterium]